MGESKEHFDLEPVGGAADSLVDSDGRPKLPVPSPTSSISPPTPPVSIPPTSRMAEEPPPSLLELAEDKCPRCGTVLHSSAVFCIKCGYDMRTNEVRKPKVGVEHVVEKPKEDEPVFSAPGRGSVQTLAIAGGVLAVAAMVFAGLNAAPPRFMPVLASVLLCLYETMLHTGTGVVAVLIAARVVELKPGRLDLAAARIFVAFAAFQLIHSITFSEYRLLVTLLMYPVALAAYWGLVMFLFRKPRMTAVTVMVAHFVLWFAVELGMGLAGYVGRTTPSAAATTPPPPALGE